MLDLSKFTVREQLRAAIVAITDCEPDSTYDGSAFSGDLVVAFEAPHLWTIAAQLACGTGHCMAHAIADFCAGKPLAAADAVVRFVAALYEHRLASAPLAVMDARDILGICAPTEEDFPALYAIQGKRVRLVVVE